MVPLKNNINNKKNSKLQIPRDEPERFTFAAFNRIVLSKNIFNEEHLFIRALGA